MSQDRGSYNALVEKLSISYSVDKKLELSELFTSALCAWY